MIDPTKLSNIYPSITVKINVRDESPRTEIGIIIKVHSKTDDSNGIDVSIDGGIRGNVIEIHNSLEIAENRILNESQHVENKDCFTADIMRHAVIPKTIQSFLNSYGGSLFIGIDDNANTIEEKIVGLKYDRDHYEKKYGPLSDEKFKDYLISELEQSLDSNLHSKTRLGPLLNYEWFNVDRKIFLEIIIPSSENPVFHKHVHNGRPIKFSVGVNHNNNFKLHDQRYLDDFYIRDGSRKIMITTLEDFAIYYNEHFR